MHWGRVRSADWVTGACGVALLAVMFADWYTVSDGGFSAWQAFGFIDKWLFLLGVLAVALPLVTAARETTPIPVALVVITVAVGLIAVPLVLFRIIDPPHEADTAWGAWAGLACVLATLVAAWRSMKLENAPDLRPPPHTELMPRP